MISREVLWSTLNVVNVGIDNTLNSFLSARYMDKLVFITGM